MRFSLSFFLTTPAKKPRTECCCQSVAFMIVAIVAPFGCRSSRRTTSCLDDPAVTFSVDRLDATALVAIALFPAPGFPAEDWSDGSRLAMRLEDFVFDCLVPIWLSLMSATASCAATATSPASGGARRERETYSLF